jgi:hypothetical protein
MRGSEGERLGKGGRYMRGERVREREREREKRKNHLFKD